MTAPRRDQDGLHHHGASPNWCFIYRKDGVWRHRSAGTANKIEARSARRRFLDALEDGRLPNELAAWPLDRLCAFFLEKRLADGISPDTVPREGRLLKQVRAVLGDRTRLGDLTLVDLVRYRNTRRAQGIGGRTIAYEEWLLRQILKMAKLWGRFADEWKPVRYKKGGRATILTPEQETVLFETARSEPRWESVYLAARIVRQLGPRGFEIKRVRLGDIDVAGGTVTFPPCKKDPDPRIVPMTPTVQQAVRHLVEIAELKGATRPDHYLFPFTCRDGWDPARHQRTFYRTWSGLVAVARRRAAEKGLEFPERLRFHDLRGMAITGMLEDGVPIDVVMDAVGHVDPETTRKYYKKIRLARIREAVLTQDKEQLYEQRELNFRAGGRRPSGNIPRDPEEVAQHREGGSALDSRRAPHHVRSRSHRGLHPRQHR